MSIKGKAVIYGSLSRDPNRSFKVPFGFYDLRQVLGWFLLKTLHSERRKISLVVKTQNKTAYPAGSPGEFSGCFQALRTKYGGSQPAGLREKGWERKILGVFLKTTYGQLYRRVRNLLNEFTLCFVKVFQACDAWHTNVCSYSTWKTWEGYGRVLGFPWSSLTKLLS